MIFEKVVFPDYDKSKTNVLFNVASEQRRVRMRRGAHELSIRIAGPIKHVTNEQAGIQAWIRSWNSQRNRQYQRKTQGRLTHRPTYREGLFVQMEASIELRDPCLPTPLWKKVLALVQVEQ